MAETIPHMKIARVNETVAGGGNVVLQDWINATPLSTEFVTADCCHLTYHLEVSTAYAVSLRIRLSHGAEAATPVTLYTWKMLLLLPGQRNVIDNLMIPSTQMEMTLINSDAVNQATVLGIIKLKVE